ncbi:uncharacterized protein [Cardiocondyla obscurior]|uniref:uncharacterized protein n=1 Tax=Cardiocondyla obscurior TaxID=286306 RepID=UPI0039656A76
MIRRLMEVERNISRLRRHQVIAGQFIRCEKDLEIMPIRTIEAKRKEQSRRHQRNPDQHAGSNSSTYHLEIPPRVACGENTSRRVVTNVQILSEQVEANCSSSSSAWSASRIMD